MQVELSVEELATIVEALGSTEATEANVNIYERLMARLVTESQKEPVT